MRLLYTTALYNDYVAHDLPLPEIPGAAAARTQPEMAAR
jgi:hypothetical protein